MCIFDNLSRGPAADNNIEQVYLSSALVCTNTRITAVVGAVPRSRRRPLTEHSSVS